MSSEFEPDKNPELRDPPSDYASVKYAAAVLIVAGGLVAAAVAGVFNGGMQTADNADKPAAAETAANDAAKPADPAKTPDAAATPDAGTATPDAGATGASTGEAGSAPADAQPEAAPAPAPEAPAAQPETPQEPAAPQQQ
jgi:hypothetical protein